MIELINKSKSYMLGPEKTATARFISKHYMDVYKILKEIIKKDMEFNRLKENPLFSEILKGKTEFEKLDEDKFSSFTSKTSVIENKF